MMEMMEMWQIGCEELDTYHGEVDTTDCVPFDEWED